MENLFGVFYILLINILSTFNIQTIFIISIYISYRRLNFYVNTFYSRRYISIKINISNFDID